MKSVTAKSLYHHLHGCEQGPATGEITEVRCTYDPSTRGGMCRVTWAMKSSKEKRRSLPLKYPEGEDFQVTVSCCSFHPHIRAVA